MIDVFFLWVYLGGIGPTYRFFRSRNDGRLSSASDAALWPLSITTVLMDVILAGKTRP